MLRNSREPRGESEDVSSRGSPSEPEDHISQDDDEQSDEEMDDVVERPKDETEEELERLVFGDEVGFRDEIHRFAIQGDATLPQLESDNALAGIQDSELFFLDEGAGQTNGQVEEFGQGRTAADKDLDVDTTERPAWEDSDDERMQVSLMAVSRLRKLRNFEGEDIISGREYARRLRRQYLALQPTPQWAKWNSQTSKKRRRETNNANVSGGENDSDSLSASDVDPYADNEIDDDDEDYSTQPLTKLLQSSQAFTRSTGGLRNKRAKLRSEVIAIERMKDIGPTQPHAITCLSLHPALPLILSTGLSSMVHLHHLKPRPTPPDQANPLITTLHLKHTPLTTARFSPRPTTDSISTTDPRIYLSSGRRYFHTWTLPTGHITKTTRVIGQQQTTQRSFETLKPSPCGRYLALLGTTRKGGGVVNILDAGTTQWIAQARVESRKGVADFAWWGDGQGMCIAGRDGEVSEWSVDERKVLFRWNDKGQVGATVITLGGKRVGTAHRKKGAPIDPLGPDRFVVTGSTSGIVNIYDRSSWVDSSGELVGPPANPVPTRSLSNLVTPISHIVFSPCGQVMSISSRWKRDALRLVHLPTCTVYRNWPTSKTPLGRISAVALGEWTDYSGGGQDNSDEKRCLVLVVGNEQGVLRGWEITG